MAFDSTIRLKQINQSELTGFVSGLIALLAPLPSGNIIPSSSGVYNLGSTTEYYKNLYLNALNLPANSGIYFGNTFVNAYTQGAAGVLSIGGYIISSSGGSIFIQGPSGATGATGATGPIGATGISITGAYWSGASSGIVFQLSNHTTLPVVTLAAFTGASGVSVTGFGQSGNIIWPQFNNRTTGVAITLPTGIQGPIGIPGTVILNYISGGNPFSQVNFPSAPYISNYYTTNPFPQLAFMRGMSYTLTLSGLNTQYLSQSQINLITGIFSGIPNVGLTTSSETAYYANPSNTTGYWRFVFFPSGTTTGIYSGEYFSSPLVPSESTDIPTSVDIYRSLTTFNVPFTAQNSYEYGFSLYGAGDTSVASGVNSTIPTGFAIVCGSVVVSSGVGPPGTSGLQGQQGIQGPVGPQGLNGYALPGVTGVTYQVVGPNQYQIQFELINGGTTNWIPLPSGGPSGAQGASGLPGSITNYWSGVYSNTTIYSINSTVSRFGSTYVYTGSIPSSGNPPESGLDWQLLAASGSIGPSGAIGYAAQYYTNFFVISGFPTGAGSWASNITGITVTGGSLSGTGARFTTGQVVSFTNSGLIGLAYSPYQQVLFSTNTYTGTYFYATINSYIPSNGTISFTVATGLSNLTGIPGTTISGTNILWYNYGNATVNLGANIVSGAQGQQGIQGIQGGSGQPSLLRQSGQIIIGSGQALTGQYVLDPTNIDAFNIIITGDGHTTIFGGYQVGLDFNWAGFPVGKSVLLKVRNSGVIFSAEPDLFMFTGSSTGIQWPNGIFTCPGAGQIYIYTIMRFMNEPDGTSGIFGTYSNPYQYNNFI